MDIKAPLAKYAQTAGADVDTDKIRESISILTGGGMPYEFRTTFAYPYAGGYFGDSGGYSRREGLLFAAVQALYRPGGAGDGSCLS